MELAKLYEIKGSLITEIEIKQGMLQKVNSQIQQTLNERNTTNNEPVKKAKDYPKGKKDMKGENKDGTSTTDNIRNDN